MFALIPKLLTVQKSTKKVKCLKISAATCKVLKFDVFHVSVFIFTYMHTGMQLLIFIILYLKKA